MKTTRPKANAAPATVIQAARYQPGASIRLRNPFRFGGEARSGGVNTSVVKRGSF